MKPYSKPKHPDAEKIEAELKAEAESLRLEREELAKAELAQSIKERDGRVNEAKRVLQEGYQLGKRSVGGVVESAKVIAECVALSPEGMDEDQARAYKYKLDAAKYSLKLHGFEADQAKQDGFNININISAEHAAKVERASSLTGGV